MSAKDLALLGTGTERNPKVDALPPANGVLPRTDSGLAILRGYTPCPT